MSEYMHIKIDSTPIKSWQALDQADVSKAFNIYIYIYY